MRTITIPAGEAVFRIGEPSAAVYVIDHGEIVIRGGEKDAAFDIAHLHDGDLFGEAGVLEGRPRSASAIAVCDTTLLETEAGAFLRAFGVDNDKALSLLKLLCRRLRMTTRQAALARADADSAEAAAAEHPAPVVLIPDGDDLVRLIGAEPIGVRKFPFLVGNRYGGETSVISSGRTYCIPATGWSDLSAPHFEILRRAGSYVIRDISRTGTILNGSVLSHHSRHAVAELRPGENRIIAGKPASPFRFRVLIPE